MSYSLTIKIYKHVGISPPTNEEADLRGLGFKLEVPVGQHMEVDVLADECLLYLWVGDGLFVTVAAGNYDNGLGHACAEGVAGGELEGQ